MTDPYKQADRERWLRDLLCGALIGAGAILPGVSGGVLAVVFDVYRPMMETAVPSPGRRIRKILAYGFLPMGIGWAVGFLGSRQGDRSGRRMLCRTPLPSGSLSALLPERSPALWREAGKEGRMRRAAWISLAASAPLSVFLTLFLCAPCASRDGGRRTSGWYNFCGALWGAGVVLPGLTSSSIMMALGLYEPLLEQSCRKCGC